MVIWYWYRWQGGFGDVRQGDNYLVRLLCAEFDVGGVDVAVPNSTHSH